MKLLKFNDFMNEQNQGSYEEKADKAFKKMKKPNANKKKIMSDLDDSWVSKKEREAKGKKKKK